MDKDVDNIILFKQISSTTVINALRKTAAFGCRSRCDLIWLMNPELMFSATTTPQLRTSAIQPKFNPSRMYPETIAQCFINSTKWLRMNNHCLKLI